MAKRIFTTFLVLSAETFDQPVMLLSPLLDLL